MTAIPSQPPGGAIKATQREYTKEEEEKYTNLLSQVKAITELPNDENSSEKTGLTATEKFWLTRECLLRYLRAVKWDVNAAEARIKKTLVWRRTIGLGEGGKLTTDAHILPEQLTGKQLIWGYDNQSRPLWYMKPDRQNTEESPRQTDHAYFMLETAKILCPRGVETVSLLINYAKKAKGPSLSTSKSVMYNLADHYPESLGTAFVINLPTVVTWMFKIISPLLDPVTRAKLSFKNDVSDMVDPSQLEDSFGGKLDMSTYNHDDYWPQLMGLAQERKKKIHQKWTELGEDIGISEWDLKDFDEK